MLEARHRTIRTVCSKPSPLPSPPSQAQPYRACRINRHLLPNSVGVIIVTATFGIADAILAVATLGFLGFGLQYPTFGWGDMLNNGVSNLQDGYWWQVYPVGVCIIGVVMACNLLGDALGDALDVRLRRR